MSADSATWPYVLAFAREMEAKLAANRHKDDRRGWLAMSPFDLLARAQGELGELTAALANWIIADGDRETYSDEQRERFRLAVIAECADAPNFCMMIADVAGGLHAAAPAAPGATDARLREAATEAQAVLAQVATTIEDGPERDTVDGACEQLSEALSTPVAGAETTIWILGRVYDADCDPAPRWSIEGLFKTESETLAAATDERDTVGSVPFSTKLPDTVTSSPGCYWAVSRRPELVGARADQPAARQPEADAPPDDKGCHAWEHFGRVSWVIPTGEGDQRATLKPQAYPPEEWDELEVATRDGSSAHPWWRTEEARRLVATIRVLAVRPGYYSTLLRQCRDALLSVSYAGESVVGWLPSRRTRDQLVDSLDRALRACV